MTFRMPLEKIAEQRALGWPDFHPEDWCHKCGRPNITWITSAQHWESAVKHEPRETLAILCPQCFARLHRENTGTSTGWVLVPIKEWVDEKR